MNYKELQEVIITLSESNLSYLEIEENGSKLILKKDSLGVALEEPVAKAYTKETPKVEHIIEKEEISNADEIVSPIVGTLYLSPEAGAKPFVSIGDHVEKGQVLCIIEAMKLMNELKCEEDGIISEILLKNEDMVEFGQPIFKIVKP